MTESNKGGANIHASSTMPMLANHLKQAEEACSAARAIKMRHMDKETLRMSEDQFMMDYIDKSNQWTGSLRMEKILYLCNNITGYVLSSFQKKCLKEMLQCMAPIIFGNPPASELAILIKKYNMKVPKTQMVFIGTGRRVGKTDSMCILVAAILCCVSNIKILFFSIYDRTCEVACNTVLGFITDFGLASKVVAKSKLKLEMKGDCQGDIRSIIFLNGQNPDVF
jgi:hypothetical protein